MSSKTTGDILEIFSGNPLLIFPPLLDVFNSFGHAAVTEVGGNLGQLFHMVRNWLPDEALSWNIIEVPELLENSKVIDLLAEEINWLSTLSEQELPSDILYFGSSLQYVEHLNVDVYPFLSIHKPRYVVIADAMVGDDIPTFVSKQHYYDDFFPTKFRNFQELSNELESLGYSLTLRQSTINSRNQHYYPSDGLPEPFQIKHPLDLVFRRV
jgi:putative methyltransferase (TIGR04325 family)